MWQSTSHGASSRSTAIYNITLIYTSSKCPNKSLSHFVLRVISEFKWNKTKLKNQKVYVKRVL